MRKSILFIVPYPHDTAPSQRLKFEQYYPKLRQHGYQIRGESFINEPFWAIVYKKGFYLTKLLYTILGYIKRYLLLFAVRRYDVVYVHLWGTPFGLPVFEWLLRKLSKRLVYDIDDLIYKGQTSPVNKFLSAFKTSAKVDYLMQNADHVLISTDKLYEYASELTTKLSVIPATINVDNYKFEKQHYVDKVVIGWSGSHTTSKYLHLLDDVLKRLATHPDIKIMVMGDNAFYLDGVDIELVKWSADTEMYNMQQFDIGLHPLPDEEWVYGKSGGKLVQYMAAGLPIVASAIGPNFRAIKHAHNGFLVTTSEEWYNSIMELVTNIALRKKMGQNSKDTALQVYSVEVNFDKYLQALGNN